MFAQVNNDCVLDITFQTTTTLDAVCDTFIIFGSPILGTMTAVHVNYDTGKIAFEGGRVTVMGGDSPFPIWAIILIVVGGVAIIGGGVFFIIKKRQQK